MGASTLDRWWQDPTRVTEHWNGVFKGGGAKGIAYVGAIRAVLEAQRWFCSVAGSSAGAISATLIAAGLEPDEIEDWSPKLLEKVKVNLAGLAFGGTTSVFAMGGVIQALRELLRSQIAGFTGEPPPVDPTFADLFAATGIELCVVAMDLATSQPIVFSHTTTPECQVAFAVAASSAIPVGFESGRLVALSPFGNGSMSVHRIVDGGAWANYPAFVYKDESFRKAVGLPDDDPPHKVVGFVLEQGGGGLAEVPWRFRPDVESDPATDIGTYVRSRKLAWLLRRLDQTKWRMLTFVFWPLVMCAATGWLIASDLETWDRLRAEVPTWIPFGRALLAMTFAAAASLLLVLSLGAFFLGRQIIRTGIGTVLAAMSVSTDVPPWLGLAPSDHVVRVPVPKKLRTWSFRVGTTQQREIIEAAHAQATVDIGHIVAGHPTIAPPHILHSTEMEKPSEVDLLAKTHSQASRQALGVYLLFGLFGLVAGVGYVLDARFSELPLRWASLVNAALYFLVPTTAGVWLYRRGAALRVATRRQEQLQAMEWSPGEPVTVAASKLLTEKKLKGRIRRRPVYALLLVAFGAWMVVDAQRQFTSDTGTATIVEREDVTSKTFLYTARIDPGQGQGEGELWDFDSHTRLAVGQQVRLRFVPGGGLELASEAETILAAFVAFLLYLVLLSVLGYGWAREDLRWLRENPDMQPPWELDPPPTQPLGPP